MSRSYNKTLKDNSFFQIVVKLVLLPLIVIALSFYILDIPLYFSLIIPSITTLMIVIGWLTPSDIIENTIASLKDDGEIYSLLITPLSCLGICFILIGSIFALIDLVILNDDEFRGFALIGFGLIFLSFSYTMTQIYINEKFLETLQEVIKIPVKKYNKIKNRAAIERKLFLSRGIFIVGCSIVIYAIYILIKSRTIPLNSLSNILLAISIFFGSVDIIGIGFVFLIFAGTFEIDAINNIIQNQILNKLKSDYNEKALII